MARDTIRIISLFMPAQAARETWRPAADVYRTPTGWLVKFELPGVHPDEVQLTARGHSLTVQGSRRDFARHEGLCHYQLEIDYGRFERTVQLPQPIDVTHCRAAYENGMLLIQIEPEGSP